ncbi:MAG TPA: ComEA family DNA-binding protein [Thermomicrobiales bacterium]|nr:ComEA family DNA-binding protein [Thermomicrobiales bacterium]HRA32094.1 ComEA family DNA-binding protein [Thermomicrobiales bacterium]
MEQPQRSSSWTWVRAMMIGVALGAVVVALMTTVLRARSTPTVVLNVVEAPDPSTIRVYVGGKVVAPGIYTLDRGSRIAEAIQAAGGEAKGGDTSSLPMAAVVQDGDQVVVPEIRPTPKAAESRGTPAPGTTREAGPIDLNHAVATELDALPGIGPTLAARIVEYRDTNGPFTSIDQLAEIRGISERMVEILRPLITIRP